MTNEQFWFEVQSKYPKSHNAFLEFMYPHHAVVRDLYDFFDAKGIYITIGFEVFEKNLFTWLAEDEEETILASGQEIPLNTRTEAESQAFTRAFQILEERLAA